MFGKLAKGLASPQGQEALYLLGATLKDIGAGAGGSDNFQTAQSFFGKRRKDAEDRAAFDAFADGMFPANLTGPGVGGNPGEVGGMTPEMRARVEAVKKLRDPQALLRLWQSNQPTYEARDGSWGEQRPGVMPREVGKLPQRASQPTLSEGYRWKAGGQDEQEYIPGGPADPVVRKVDAEIRRRALVENPMPVRRGAGGGGTGGSGGGKPWERKW